ncbi:energy-coupling factor transporter transmembrane component T family protein [Paramicrobacterium agarici]|uniref:Energy-coupling factor transport system permease protein n=1 Tax=Paramicrobacterium agarici TaxID=630514 RepID=A0A2A9DYP1_9MICO|nr:energy-coupling factor transporter transmembrane component T [Microbacterium agarici]PFG31486.1 energy-coupling factor transport system permease protein [Microbacterium agarici]
MSAETVPLAPSLAARINPVAKLIAALVISVTLLLSVDIVSAAVALVLTLALVGFAGLSARSFWIRTAPVWFAAPFAAITTVLYGEDAGAQLAGFGIATISEGSLMLGVAIMLRVLAIGIPGVVLMATTDPTELADGLSQVLKLPARFVLGALAGMRMIGLFIDDWRAMGRARRARGVADSQPIRRFAAQAFALLVLAIRRGSKLATAMEAKGFGSSTPRTWARESRFGTAEVVLVGIGVLIAAAAVSSALAVGTWSFVLA